MTLIKEEKFISKIVDNDKTFYDLLVTAVTNKNIILDNDNNKNCFNILIYAVNINNK